MFIDSSFPPALMHTVRFPLGAVAFSRNRPFSFFNSCHFGCRHCLYTVYFGPFDAQNVKMSICNGSNTILSLCMSVTEFANLGHRLFSLCKLKFATRG